jgi:hypothetical protein
VLDWLANTAYAQWVNQSWGWAVALTLHAFGTAIVVSLTFIISLRLLGLFRTIPYSVLPSLIRLIWLGVACQIVSGLSLWTVKPAQYLADGMFEVKMGLLAVAIGVTWYLQRTMKREVPTWEAAGTVSSRGTRIVAAAAFLWASVLIGGRLTAYLGSLYPT